MEKCTTSATKLHIQLAAFHATRVFTTNNSYRTIGLLLLEEESPWEKVTIDARISCAGREFENIAERQQTSSLRRSRKRARAINKWRRSDKTSEKTRPTRPLQCRFHDFQRTHYGGNVPCSTPVRRLRRRSTRVTESSLGSNPIPHHSLRLFSPSCQPALFAHPGPAAHQKSVISARRSSVQHRAVGADETE